jgi:hypothetical protein
MHRKSLDPTTVGLGKGEVDSSILSGSASWIGNNHVVTFGKTISKST